MSYLEIWNIPHHSVFLRHACSLWDFFRQDKKCEYFEQKEKKRIQTIGNEPQPQIPRGTGNERRVNKHEPQQQNWEQLNSRYCKQINYLLTTGPRHSTWPLQRLAHYYISGHANVISLCAVTEVQLTPFRNGVPNETHQSHPRRNVVSLQVLHEQLIALWDHILTVLWSRTRFPGVPYRTLKGLYLASKTLPPP